MPPDAQAVTDIAHRFRSTSTTQRRQPRLVADELRRLRIQQRHARLR
jgi:hypothetical protein